MAQKHFHFQFQRRTSNEQMISGKKGGESANFLEDVCPHIHIHVIRLRFPFRFPCVRLSVGRSGVVTSAGPRK